MKKPIELLKAAVEHFKVNPKLFLGVVLVPLVISILIAVFEPSRNTGVINMYEWTVYGVLMALLFVFNILMGVALILVAANPTLTVRGAYGQATEHFWKYLGFSIVMSIILSIGVVLLVVPAIIFLVWFAFAVFVLVLEKTSIVDSIKRSREYTRGRWWNIFGRSVFIILVSVIILAPLVMIDVLIPGMELATDVLSGLVSAFITPFTLIYMYLMYQEVKMQSPAPIK